MNKIIQKKMKFGIFSDWLRQIVLVSIGILTMPIYFRFMPKEEVGIWMLLLGTEIFIELSNFGFTPILSRQIAFEIGQKNKRDQDTALQTSHLYRISQRVSLFSGIIVLVGFLGFGSFFFLRMQIDPLLLKKSLIALAFFSVGQAVRASFKYVTTALDGHGEVGWHNWILVIERIFSLCIGILFLYLGYGIVGLSVVWIIRVTIGSILGVACVKWRIPEKYLQKQKIKAIDISPYLQPSLDWFLMGFGAFLTLNTDQYFISLFMGPSALPDYAATFRLVIIIATFSGTISNISMPFVSRMSSAMEYDGVKKLLMVNVTFSMALYFTGAMVIAIYCDTIVRIWLGLGHFIGWAVVWVFCIMRAMENHIVAFARIALSVDTKPIWGKMALLSGSLNLVLTLIGVKYFGLLGVALGTLITQLLTSNWYAVWRTLSVMKIRFIDYFADSCIYWILYSIFLFVINKSMRIWLASDYISLIGSMIINSISLIAFVSIYLKVQKNKRVSQRVDKTLQVG